MILKACVLSKDPVSQDFYIHLPEIHILHPSPELDG